MRASVDGRFLGRALVTALALLWLLAVWVNFGGALIAAARAPDNGSYDLDFFTFLDSSVQLRRGEPLYVPIRSVLKSGGARTAPLNLNHPALAVALVPLTPLDRFTAYLLWTALNIAAYLLAVALALRELGLARARVNLPLSFALALTLPGVLYSLELGELGLLLALPVTGTWILLRRGRAVAAGLLLGALIALKPFLLLLVPLLLIRRDWRGLLSTGAGALGLSLAALAATGPGAFRDWLATMRIIGWYAQNTNISLTGVLYRVVRPAADSPATLGLALTWGPVLLVGLAALLLLRAPVDGARGLDRGFAVLLVLAVLGSPLGWLYYLPLLVPAFVLLLDTHATLPRAARPLVLTGVALLWLPHAFLPLAGASVWGQLTLGATPTYGLIALACGLILALPSLSTQRARSIAPTVNHTRGIPAQQG